MERARAYSPAAPRTLALKRLLVPSPVDAIFVFLVFAVPFLVSQRIFSSDGDLARHIRVGSTILERGGLFYEDLFSYTAAGQAFIPFEWLSEVAFAGVYRLWGLAGALVLTSLVVALTYALVIHFLRRHGVDPLLSVVVGCAAAALGSIHWLARPHIFSLLGVILTLELVERSGRRALLSFIPLFAVWANLHGGFLFGLIVIGLYFTGDLVEWWLAGRSGAWRARIRYHAAAFGVAIFGTLINPVGPKILGHVLGYLGNSYLVAAINEYNSPDFHNPFMRLFLLVVLLLIGILVHQRRRLTYPHLLLLLATLGFAFHSARNIPLFALTALPVLALEWDAAWRALPWRWLRRLRGAVDIGEREGSRGVWAASASLIMVLTITGPGNGAITTTFNPGHYPVAVVERAREAGLAGNIFNYFIWGGYLLHAWPEQKVFIDGQVDFYGEELTRTYGQVMGLQPGWRDVLDHWNVALVLIPSKAPLAEALLLTGEWQVWHCDATAVLLFRADADLNAIGSEPAKCPLDKPTAPSGTANGEQHRIGPFIAA